MLGAPTILIGGMFVTDCLSVEGDCFECVGIVTVLFVQNDEFV